MTQNQAELSFISKRIQCVFWGKKQKKKYWYKLKKHIRFKLPHSIKANFVGLQGGESLWGLLVTTSAVRMKLSARAP